MRLCMLVLVFMGGALYGQQGADVPFISLGAAHYQRSPEELLAYLESHYGGDDKCACVALSTAPDGWLTLDNVIPLFRLTSQETKCLPTYNRLSSTSNWKPSTIGTEARRMIQGYLFGRYPPMGTTTVKTSALRRKLIEKVTAELDAQLTEAEGKQEASKPTQPDAPQR